MLTTDEIYSALAEVASGKVTTKKCLPYKSPKELELLVSVAKDSDFKPLDSQNLKTWETHIEIYVSGGIIYIKEGMFGIPGRVEGDAWRLNEARGEKHLTDSSGRYTTAEEIVMINQSILGNPSILESWCKLYLAIPSE